MVKVASKARNTKALAISAGSPNRPIGLASRIWAAASFGITFSRIPVAMGPG